MTGGVDRNAPQVRAGTIYLATNNKG